MDRLDNQVNTPPAAPQSSSLGSAFRSLSVWLSLSVSACSGQCRTAAVRGRRHGSSHFCLSAV